VTAPEIVRALHAVGASAAEEIGVRVAADPARLAALQKPDFVTGKTAAEHILRLAQARTLFNGEPSSAIAADLFGLVGGARSANTPGVRCYGLADHTVFSKYHPGEFARLIADLATTGRVTLANKEVLEVDAEKAAAGKVAISVDSLFVAMINLGIEKDLPSPAVLSIGGQGPTVYQGQMANLQTRLMGRRYINVPAQEALTHLNDIIAAHGPLLAEYGSWEPGRGGTAGGVAGVNGDAVFSMNDGGDRHSGAVGYIAVPAEEAKRRGLKILEYPDSKFGYTGS
jgi:hypothetical protein